MKRNKKIFAMLVLITILVALFSGVIVFAEESAASEETSARVERFQNFDSISAGALTNENLNTLNLEKNPWKSISARNISEHEKFAAYKHEIAGGVFGKAADDNSLHIYNDKWTTQESTDPQQQIMFDDNDSLMQAQVGEYTELSFDMAIGGGNETTTIIGYLYNTFSGNDGKCNILDINSGGGLSFLGSTVEGINIKKNTWYNFRMLFLGGEKSNVDNPNRYKLYINGNLIKEDTFIPKARNNECESFLGLWRILFAQAVKGNTLAVGQEWQQRDLYIDNFKNAVYTSEPTKAFVSQTLDFNAVIGQTVASVNESLALNKASFANLRCRDDSEVYKVKVEKGVYGKAADDTSICIDVDTTKKGSTADPTQWFEVVPDSSNNKTAVQVEKGEIYELEFYYARAKDKTEFNIDAFYIGDPDNPSGGDGKNTKQLLKISKDGTEVTAFGNSVSNVTIQDEKWYKFNIVIKSGDNSAAAEEEKNQYRLYIDNKLVSDGVFEPIGRGTATSYNTFRGFCKFWFTQFLGNKNYNGDPSSYYIDDISISNHGLAAPAYTQPTLSSGDIVEERYNSSESLFRWVDERVNFDNVAWQCEGAELKRIPDTNYFRLESQNSGPVYAKIIDTTREVVREAFNQGTENREIEILSNATVALQETHGVAGRADNDYSKHIVTAGLDNIKGGEGETLNYGATYVHYNMPGGVGVTKPLHVEYSVRALGKFDNVHLQLISQHDGHDERKNVVALLGDGQIVDSQNKVWGETKPGEWVKFGASLYTDTNTLEIRVNGKVLYTTQLWSDKSYALTRFKIEQGYSAAASDAEVIMDVDDFSVYEGALPNALKTGSTLSADKDSGYTVFNCGRIIYLEDTEQESFWTGIKGFRTDVAPSIFTDSRLENKINSADIESGNILCVSDGGIYNYYYLAEGSPQKIQIMDKSADGSELKVTPGVTSVVTPVFRIFDRNFAGATVMVAQYNASGALVSIGIANIEDDIVIPGKELITDSYIYPVEISGWDISIEAKKAEGASYKIFVFDSLGNISPLATPSTSIKEVD